MNTSRNKKRIIITIVVAALAIVAAILVFNQQKKTATETETEAETKAEDQQTATPTPCPVVTGRPKEIPTTVDLPEPGKDWEPVNKTWLESSIEKWGKGDIDESTYSYLNSKIYKDPNGVYFRLYHFRVYIFEGRNWVRSEVFPLFEGKIVIGEGPRLLVLSDKGVEVWERDYYQEEGHWHFYRLFAVVTDTSDIRVFGEWFLENSASKAYIASNEEEEIWTISTGSITTRHYDDVVFSDTSIFVVEGTTLTRVAYGSQLRFKTRSGFTSTNKSALEGGTTLLEFGDDTLDPIKFAGGAVHEKDGMVFVQENMGKIIFF